MLEHNQHERNVVLGEVPPDQAVAQIRSAAAQQIEGIENAVITFQKVESYTSFSAEYAWVEQDLVLHFFLPPEKKLPEADAYWLTKFPTVLDVTAREFFKADYPRLAAKYTEELSSWWFKARGYGHVIDPDAFAIKFLKDLDAAIDAS